VTGTSAIARIRLRNQGIADPRFTSPHAVVSWFGAMQAQDYLGALWAVGLRMKKAVEADIERALAEKKIVRSWPLRGTLHFVAGEDLKWMLELLAPRVIARNAARLKREFELDASALRRCRTVVIRELQGGRQLTRGEFYDALDRVRIRTTASRGLHIIFALAHERLICFGPRRAKQQTFVLLDEWAPRSTNLKGDEALHELARRYFASHNPASMADFAWWSGLPAVEAKRGAEMVGVYRKRKRAIVRNPSAWLLPAFDEYLVGYKDRSAVIDPAYAKRVNAGGGILNPTIVVGGEVIGTWKRIMRREGVAITRSLFRPLKKGEERIVSDAEERYANFVGVRLC
jgi:winged helix DNA-binding protein